MSGRSWQIHEGDALEVLRGMEPASFDAIVTDPPYGLGFMGKAWDSLPPGDVFAKELLRVLKPGAHLVAFGGTRTYHRLACAIEDAGFEIRDSLAWIYGQGFPKSLDVSKAMDRAAGLLGPESVRFTAAGRTDKNLPNPVTKGYAPPPPKSEDAVRWIGWGTALKPAHEPIVLARKPLAGTVAANVAEHGTGALNVDGCRVGTARRFNPAAGNPTDRSTVAFGAIPNPAGYEGQEAAGRWPPNVLLTHAADCGDECAEGCPVREMDAQSGELQTRGNVSPSRSGLDTFGFTTPHSCGPEFNHGDSGGASRFFPRFRYEAKASSGERNAGLEGMPEGWLATMSDGIGGREHNEAAAPRVANHHPTVKPIALMRWLCRLVTPPGGLILDPFLGSGTTMVAALQEGFRCVGIEREHEYVEIARRRVEEDMPLFNREPTNGAS